MNPPKEAFQFMRLIMVLSSMAPLFFLWAVRGSTLIPNLIFITACLLLAIVPTALLLRRIQNAKTTNDCQMKTVFRADDHKDHILVYPLHKGWHDELLE